MRLHPHNYYKIVFLMELTFVYFGTLVEQPGVLHVVQSGNNKPHSGGGGVARLH